ncbi:MAG TPA: N-succinylarginine dihydrolase [Polyangiaceae bacterium]|nr:N-succinylarginine dihydrolase [Polyangiaceae bacterium]
MREYNFDGLVGPTHHYAGLSYGNLASSQHRGEPSNPRSAALEGLEKAWFVAKLGVGQALLPPPLRPNLRALHQLGFSGTSRDVLPRVLRSAPELLALTSSSSAMWAANAATVAPSSDTTDGRVHFTPANLSSMFHRSLEASATTATLRAIFGDLRHFVVHDALPAGELFADEGAANHLRLSTTRGVVHVFGWGREASSGPRPRAYPARQTREASAACARLHGLRADQLLFLQQAPEGIDAGAFHSDVLAVGNAQLLLVHELAFVGGSTGLAQLRACLGEELEIELATNAELPVGDAVRAYPFNSQLVSLPEGGMAIIAPEESRASPSARAFLERVLAGRNPVNAVHYVNVNGSMKNGGGPACLRLRVPLNDAESRAISGRVLLDAPLYQAVHSWISASYRDRVAPADLADPDFFEENQRALAELSALLRVPIDLYE